MYSEITVVNSLAENISVQHTKILGNKFIDLGQIIAQETLSSVIAAVLQGNPMQKTELIVPEYSIFASAVHVCILMEEKTPKCQDVLLTCQLTRSHKPNS